jgi:molybdopterin-synthase adenylyltransferase
MSAGRYAQLERIDWWDGQRVAAARALVVGAGALGNEVIKNLLLLGWGCIVVVDHDHIEESNLTRSVLFRADDVGEPKASTVARNAELLNPDCQVIGLDTDLRLGVSPGLLARVDVVFGCVDNVAARVALAQLAGNADCLHIDGGLTIWEGTVKVLLSSDGACYTCGLTEEDRRDLALRRSCLAYQARARAAQGVPTTPTVASITAGVMVQQALKWLHSQQQGPAVPIGHEIRVDTAHDRLWKTQLPRNDDCPIHPEAVKPKGGTPLPWTESWANILESCRRDLGSPDVALHLPLQVLEMWECPDCGTKAEVFRAHTGDDPIICTACGHAATPMFANQVLGEEPWLGLSPREMAFPPWTWVWALADGQEQVIELAGASEPLTELERR